MVNPVNIYSFGLGAESTETAVEILGGKGAGLVWMSNHGFSVPPGFIIPTPVWAQYKAKPKATIKAIASAIKPYLAELKKHFGYAPLLSVRSGARVSCPGMMDTILNVGIDKNTAAFWTEKLGQACFVDSTERLITMYGSVVNGVDRKKLEAFKGDAQYASYYNHTGHVFPNAEDQLLGAIEAVFLSWDNERAKTYRKLNSIPAEWGTAVTVQAMVFGNLNEQSGTGVLFTRNCQTGENLIWGEFLANAQGEDVVAGIRTPAPLSTLAVWNQAVSIELHDAVTKLETLKKDVQDVEFTVQDGKLYLLQTRTAKRGAVAAIKIALDLVAEGLITPRVAISRVTAKQFDLAQQDVIDPSFKKAPAFHGLAASSGVVTGKPVFSAADAVASKVPCILITDETTPDDIAGMARAQGTITMTGGLTSHAAVVARGMNWPCVTGVGKQVADFKKFSTVSFDGSTGAIWTVAVPIVSGKASGLTASFARLVHETLKLTPIITAEPAESLGQALCYLGDGIFDTQVAFTTITRILGKVGTLYLDLTGAQNHAQTTFEVMFGSYDAAGALVKALEAVYPALINPGKLILVGAQSTVFPTVENSKDISSLVLAENEVLLDGIDTTDPAVAKVLAWRSKDGLEILSLGRLVQGQKSFLSIEQGLQLVSI